MATSLAIIIPYWHGEHYLPASLGSIAQNHLPAEIQCTVVIVHNGGSYPEIPPDTGLNVRILSTKEDLGFARAVNTGLHYAHQHAFDLIMLLNQDAILAKDCLGALLSAMHTGPAIYAPLVMNHDLSDVPDWYASKYYTGVDIHSGSLAIALRNISATCVLGTAGSFAVGGFFDPVFRMYYEDDDYFQRFLSKGGSVFLVPQARVGHLSGSTESRQGDSRFRKRKGALMFQLRHKSWPAALGRMLRHYASCIVRFRLRTLMRFIRDDFGLLKRSAYIRHATFGRINACALRQLQNDAAEDPWPGA